MSCLSLLAAQRYRVGRVSSTPPHDFVFLFSNLLGSVPWQFAHVHRAVRERNLNAFRIKAFFDPA